MKAVLVDNMRLNIELLETFLRLYCPRVNVVGTAESFDEAHEVINKEQPDILFLDTEIFNNTVNELLNSIRQENIYVIIISVYDNYIIERPKYPITGYLLKPIRITELIAVVNKALSDFEPK